MNIDWVPTVCVVLNTKAGRNGPKSLPSRSTASLGGRQMRSKQWTYTFGGLCYVACGILVPGPGVGPGLWQWKYQVLITGPPGKSPMLHSIEKIRLGVPITTTINIVPNLAGWGAGTGTGHSTGRWGRPPSAVRSPRLRPIWRLVLLSIWYLMLAVAWGLDSPSRRSLISSLRVSSDVVGS